MSLRDVMAFIQKRQCASHAGAADTPDHAGAADTPDTPVKPVGYHLKAAWTVACTPDSPDTPALCETRTHAQTGQRGEASNDTALWTRPPRHPCPGCQTGARWTRHIWRTTPIAIFAKPLDAAHAMACAVAWAPRCGQPTMRLPTHRALCPGSRSTTGAAMATAAVWTFEWAAP